jgi:hypothetical protein
MKEFIINIIFLFLSILIFTSIKNFWTAMLLFIILALVMIIYRLFYTDLGKMCVTQIKFLVNNIKARNKEKDVKP